MSCQIDPMRMSCINIHHHQDISSLIANSFIAYVGIEKNFTILFLEELLNVLESFSSRRHTKLASWLLRRWHPPSPKTPLPNGHSWLGCADFGTHSDTSMSQMNSVKPQTSRSNKKQHQHKEKGRTHSHEKESHLLVATLDWLSCMLKLHLQLNSPKGRRLREQCLFFLPFWSVKLVSKRRKAQKPSAFH